MDICFEGIGQVVATFHTKAELTPGMAVTMIGSGEVGLGSGASLPCGVTVGAERGGAAAVQIGGVAKVGYADGETFDVGYAVLVCDEKGKVAKSEDGGVSCLVLAVDESEKTIAVKL